MSSRRSSRNSKICDICREIPGVDYCNDCDQLFCQHCKLLHMRTKSNRFHTFRNSSATKSEIESQICDQHNEEFIYYCDKCEEPCCKACIFSVHKGHNMSDIADAVAKKKKMLSSTWEVYIRKLESARSSVDTMETSLNAYRQKVYKTIREIEREGIKIKTEIDKAVSSMIKDLREKETQELQRVTDVINGLKAQLDRGIKLKQHVTKALKTKNDTAMLVSLGKFQKDMGTYIPEVILPSDFSYAKGNSESPYVQSLLGRVFFENGKGGRETPVYTEAKDDIKRNAKPFQLWMCQVCGTERLIERTSEHPDDFSFRTPRCCYGFMKTKGIAYM